MLATSDMDESLIPGYYHKKYKTKVETVSNFVAKVRRTHVCDEFLAQSDPDYGGVAKLVHDFYSQVRTELV